jgi:hypothetical protein
MTREIEPELRELIARLAAAKACVALGQIMATPGAIHEVEEDRQELSSPPPVMWNGGDCLILAGHANPLGTGSSRW